MKRRRSFRSLLRLARLEDRLAPAALVNLISSAEPAMLGDSGAGISAVGWDPIGGSIPSVRTVSDDGRYIAFASKSANLIAGQVEANNGYDVFVYDRVANQVELISRNSASAVTTGNGESSNPALSSDGRLVVFSTTAVDLVAGMSVPAAGKRNIVLFDRQTGASKLVSHDSSNSLLGASEDAINPHIASNGSAIVFSSPAANLTPGFPAPVPGSNLTAHSFVFDCSTSQVTLLDRAFGSATAPGNARSAAGFPSPDGRYIMIASFATNLLSSPTTSNQNAYRYDRQTGDLLLISQNNGTTPLGGNGANSIGPMSVDGRWVLLRSEATNLSGGTSTTGSQYYLYDTLTAVLILASHAHDNASVGGDGNSFFGSMSPNGRFVTFLSLANNLVANFADGNGSATYDTYLFDRLSGIVSLASYATSSLTTSGNEGTGGVIPRVDDTGSVVFADLSSDLVSGFVDTNNFTRFDLYRYENSTKTVSLLSGRNGSQNIGGDGDSRFAAINLDGSVVTWASGASNLSSTIVDVNGRDDVYVRDLAAGTIHLASRRLGVPSASAGGFADWERLSADGRFVVFTSTAANLVPGQIDAPDTVDVFLTDRQTGATVMVSRVAGTIATGANDVSGIPVISDDGRYVAYCSGATNIIQGFADLNGPNLDNCDVYLFDRLTGTNVLISHQFDSLTTSGDVFSGATRNYHDLLINISGDGRYVAFASGATNLVSGFVNNNGTSSDVYVYDRVTGVNKLVSHVPNDPLAGNNGSALQPKLSGDGQYVVYFATGNNLITGMSGGGRNVYLYDQQAQTTALVSHAASSLTTSGNAGSNAPGISFDGRFITYQSASNNLVAGQTDSNNLDDIFLYDRVTGENVLVSHRYDSATTAGDRSSHPYSGNQNDARVISGDGRFIVYKSGASDLVPNFVDNNGQALFDDTKTDVFLFDRVTGTNTLISHAFNSPGNSGNAHSLYQQISRDGRFITFASDATDLAAGWSFPATNLGQVVLLDQLTGKLSLLSHTPAGKTIAGDLESYWPTISANGAVVSFLSRSTNLTLNDFNGFDDVFSYVQLPPTVLSVQFGDHTDQRSMVKQIVVTFSEPVSFMGSIASSFTLHRQGSVGDVTLTANPTSGPVSSVTITFSGSFTESGGSLVDGRYDLIIDAAQVSGVGGALDGNSDGIAGGSYVISGTAANRFYRLFGDSDGDGTVSQLPDLTAMANAIGNPSTIFDFDNDGSVDQDDLLKFRNNFGGGV